MVDTHEHTGLTGPAGAEAARRLEDFGAHAPGFPGTVVTDRRQLERLMRRHDPAVYPGTYVTCVYDHAKALCRKATARDGQPAPTLGDCKPTTCGNVALTAQNTAAWRQEGDRIDARLTARPPLPPLLEHRLRQRREEITRFLGRATRKDEAS